MYIPESVIEDNIKSYDEDFEDRLGDATDDFDDLQDLSVTDPALLKGTPYDPNPDPEPEPRLHRQDWSVNLNGGLH